MNRVALLWSGVGCLLAATVLGAVVALGVTDAPAIDRWWNTVVADQRGPWLINFAHFMNEVGGGWIAVLVIPLSIMLALVIARRWRSAVFAAAAFVLSAAAVQLLKHLFSRTRPDDMLVASDFGSFPSGHAANAATVALVFWLIFPRVWVALVGIAWVMAMAYSRTLLSVHWATDTLGGALVGAAIVLLLGALLLPWIETRTREVAARAG